MYWLVLHSCTTLICHETLFLSPWLQSQYVFIHDALDELITCGETEIAAHNLNIAINQLGRIAPGKSLSGYEEQFQVY